MRVFEADLHVHTVLSPCAADEMTPPSIVRAALERGLEMIAVCDHNSARNASAVVEAAGAALSVLAGMEMTTSEEVHVVAIFPDVRSALEASREVRETLPDATDATTRRFGEQRIASATGETVGRETKLLATATGLDIARTVRLIRRHRGLAVAAHVDRPSFSIFSQLGFFPIDAGLDAIEISPALASPPWAREIDALPLPRLRSSDSHFLSDLGSARTLLRMEAPTFSELALALVREGGRGVV